MPGGSQLIKDAISKPGDPEIQEEVWEKMLPLIHNLTDLKQSYSALNEVPFGKKKFFFLYKTLQMIPEILGQLWEEKKDRLESFLSFITSHHPASGRARRCLTCSARGRRC